MRQEQLKPVWKRKFVHTTDSRHGLAVAPNVLAWQFNSTAPNVAYASDISYIRTGAGRLYLAVVLDLFSRKVVGWAMLDPKIRQQFSTVVLPICRTLAIGVNPRRSCSSEKMVTGRTRR
jgi:transposase InsO family protein